jgi:hypothetical protein
MSGESIVLVAAGTVWCLRPAGADTSEDEIEEPATSPSIGSCGHAAA